MTNEKKEMELKPWYYKQHTVKGPYFIYDPNRVNKYVAEVRSLEDAENICNAMNTRHDTRMELNYENVFAVLQEIHPHIVNHELARVICQTFKPVVN